MRRKDLLEKLVNSIIPWYLENQRDLPWRKDSNPYHIWLSEIMLQQTRIEAVIPYYNRFISEIPDIPSLAKADLDDLYKLWEGLGYYSRVRNLKEAANQIIENYDGSFPNQYEEIKKLKGIGNYTAGAIGSICFNLPTCAIDGNVMRVLSRITADKRQINDLKVKKEIECELQALYPKENCGALTQGIMELGETICLPNGAPNCDNCPCSSFCKSKDGLWNKIPIKKEKKERKKEIYTVFLLTYQNQIAISQRKRKRLTFRIMGIS